MKNISKGFVGVYIPNTTQANIIKPTHIREHTTAIPSSGTSEGGFYVPDIYSEAAQYPTRDKSSTVFFTWNSKKNDTSTNVRAYRVRRLLIEQNPVSIELNPNWNIDDDNPFSNTMPDSKIRSDLDIKAKATDGDLYREQFTSGFGHYYVLFVLTYTYNGGKGIMWISPGNSKLTHNLIGRTGSDYSAPAINYNASTGDLTISPLVSGRRIIEFCRGEHPEREELYNEMYYTSLLDLEWDNPYQGYYYLINQKPVLKRWAPGQHTVTVKFTEDRNKDVISNAIDNAISKINAVLKSYGVSFIRTSDTSGGNISIIVKSENAIQRENDDYSRVYGGTWETEHNNGKITRAVINLANDYYESYAPFLPYQTVALEELIQSMGAGFDQVEYPFNTIHTDFNYYNKAKDGIIPDKDKSILSLVYSDKVTSGMSYTEVALALNVPKGCYVPSKNTDNAYMTVSLSSFLKRGTEYRVRVFIVDQWGQVSKTTDWISVLVPRTSVSKWDWNSVNGENATLEQTQKAYNALNNKGKLSDFSYKVWNDMCDKVKEIQDYKGIQWDESVYGLSFSETKMGLNDKTLTAQRYNSLRYNVGRSHSTGINKVSSGEAVKAKEHFLDLMNAVNSWIDAL